MHVLITGGTGFIGCVLARHLLDLGHEVSVFSRRPDQVPRQVDPRCRGIGALQPQDLRQPVDAVINLAGEPIADRRWSEPRKRQLFESRILLTEELVLLMGRLQPRPRVLVSASAVGYYGDQGDRTVTETCVPHNEYTHELCAAWEAAALMAESIGTRVVLARLGLVVGPGGGFLQRMLTPFRLGLGGRLGDGHQFMPWIHRDDVVQILTLLATDEHARGAYNVVSPEPVTNREFTRTLAKVLHRPALFPVPAVVLRGLLGEMSRLLLTGQKALPTRLGEELQYAFRHPLLEAALRATLAA